MELLRLVNYAIAVAFILCYTYQIFYIPISFIKKKAPPPTAARNRFAVLICARNEEKVIADLLDSLREQTYDRQSLLVFVIADNCSDATAGVARKAGATVYERFNTVLVGKGYAMQELAGHIARDFPGRFDGYFVFDADNVLEPDFIEHMNRTFSAGYEIVTSYRNSKNYGDNWISAGYSLWFLREARFLNQPRFLLGASCAISGTGFLFSQRVLDSTGGWRFHTLTEDIEFTAHHILNGVKIGYCPDAVLYDEQPVTWKQSWHQRLRWAKGYLQVFRKHGLGLLRGVLRGNYSCYDMCMHIMPAIALTFVSVFSNTVLAVLGAARGAALGTAFQSVGETLFDMYVLLFVIGAITTATEWKKIHTAPLRKLLYTVTFPIFMLTYIPISLAALFSRVEWKPISHTVSAAALRKNKNMSKIYK